MQPSINRIKASDGSGNASVATIQAVRSAGATTIEVDTVQGINTEFMGTMGTPHTFEDPITGEEITIISEATAVDFAGHVDGSDLEIDEIADGYTDNGSAVGDIVIIRPTTQWADKLAEVLEVSLNDDGTLKAVTENPGWTALAYTPDTVVAEGNRNYTCTFNGVDLTGAISPGMKLRAARTVPGPTQCADLEASSSQYATRAAGSVTGQTFTDDFTVEAQIKLESYGGVQAIMARVVAGFTAGWELYIDAQGKINLIGRNGAAHRYLRSHQSIPLGEWLHIAMTLDLSGWTTATNKLFINGVSVPIDLVTGAGTPTAIVQGGDMQIGARAGGDFLDGKISEARIWSTIRNETEIRANMSQQLTGAEANLVGYWKLNGNFNDSTSNANNLTAAGSATATNADSPFGRQASGLISSTLEYAEVLNATFSTNTVIQVRVPDGNALPTSGGISALSYSTQESPYGMPALGNILGIAIRHATFTTNSTTMVPVLGFILPVIIPPGRKIKLTLDCGQLSNSVLGAYTEIFIADGASPGGISLNAVVFRAAMADQIIPLHMESIVPASGSKTYSVGMNVVVASSASLGASMSSPVTFKVELVE